MHRRCSGTVLAALSGSSPGRLEPRGHSPRGSPTPASACVGGDRADRRPLPMKPSDLGARGRNGRGAAVDRSVVPTAVVVLSAQRTTVEGPSSGPRRESPVLSKACALPSPCVRSPPRELRVCRTRATVSSSAQGGEEMVPWRHCGRCAARARAFLILVSGTRAGSAPAAPARSRPGWRSHRR
jgi:hypothetical protein